VRGEVAPRMSDNDAPKHLLRRAGRAAAKACPATALLPPLPDDLLGIVSLAFHRRAISWATGPVMTLITPGSGLRSDHLIGHVNLLILL